MRKLYGNYKFKHVFLKCLNPCDTDINVLLFSGSLLRTPQLSCSILSSVCTSACLRTRSDPAIPLASSATSLPRNTTTSTCSYSKGKVKVQHCPSFQNIAYSTNEPLSKNTKIKDIVTLTFSDFFAAGA